MTQDTSQRVVQWPDSDVIHLWLAVICVVSGVLIMAPVDRFWIRHFGAFAIGAGGIELAKSAVQRLAQ